jgi:hypothetical protein
MLPTCGRLPASIGGSANFQGSCHKFGTIPIPVQKSIPKIISCQTSGTTNTSKTPTLLSNVTVPMHAVSEADARIQHSTSIRCIRRGIWRKQWSTAYTDNFFTREPVGELSLYFLSCITQSCFYFELNIYGRLPTIPTKIVPKKKGKRTPLEK